MGLRRTALPLAAAAVLLAGCASNSATPSGGTSAAPTAGATAAGNADQGVKIYLDSNCQTELIDGTGKRILIDVWNPAQLSAPATAQDILLTTHLHNDHYIATFADTFPGEKVTNQAGEFTVGGVKVTSLDASHQDDTILTGADASNHIFVFDFGGIRFAHLGSTGQTALTPDQLGKLGNVDVAFAVLTDVSGQVDELRPLHIVEQLKPRVLVPTHTKLETVQAAGAKWKGTYATKPFVTVHKSKLPAATEMLFIGQLATSYGAILKFPETTW